MKLPINRKPVDLSRPLHVRAAMAALAIATAFAAPAVVAAEATVPTGTTVSADPNQAPAIPDPPGNPVGYAPQFTYPQDDYYYVPDAGGGGGGGG